MASPKQSAPQRGTKLLVSVGLVNVPVKIGPFVRDLSVKGTMVCPDHKVPAKSGAKVCAHDGHEVAEAVTGFEYGGQYVTGIDRKEHRSSKDGTLALRNSVELASLDPGVFERTYLVWPDDGGAPAYDLLAAALRKTGKALIGTTAISTSTKAIALRWSEPYGCLLAHVLAYDEAVRTDDVELVKAGMASRPEPAEAQVAMAEQLLDQLTDDFELADVADEYRESLLAAIDAAAKGLPAPKVEEAAPVEAPVDLMEALKASVAKSQPKAKAKAKAKPKPRARKKVTA